MSGYTKFADVGAGASGNYIVQELLKDEAARIVKKVAILPARLIIHPVSRRVTGIRWWVLGRERDKEG